MRLASCDDQMSIKVNENNNNVKFCENLGMFPEDMRTPSLMNNTTELLNFNSHIKSMGYSKQRD